MFDLTATSKWGSIFDRAVIMHNMTLLMAAQYQQQYISPDQTNPDLCLPSLFWSPELFDYSDYADAINCDPEAVENFIDGVIVSIIEKGLSCYLVPEPCQVGILKGYQQLACTNSDINHHSCMALDGHKVLNCWKALLYADYTDNASLHCHDHEVYTEILNPVEEGFMVYNTATGKLLYPPFVDASDPANILVYVFPLVHGEMVRNWLGIRTSVIFHRGQFDSGSYNDTYFNHIEGLLRRLDELTQFYDDHKLLIDDFFTSLEGQALLCSPVIPYMYINVKDDPQLDGDSVAYAPVEFYLQGL